MQGKARDQQRVDTKIAQVAIQIRTSEGTGTLSPGDHELTGRRAKRSEEIRAASVESPNARDRRTQAMTRPPQLRMPFLEPQSGMDHR
ncbi:hypothetical protein D3C81_2073860 [compost metagenome]